MTSTPYSQFLKAVVAGNDLSDEQTHEAFTCIMDGLWSPAQIAGLLVALSAKGETVEEIAGAARAMREHVVPIATDGREVIDTCGTGGTGISTFNVSTASAMVLAGMGVTVAKHGNRTHTRASGSANVLEELGVNLDASPDLVAQCLQQANVGFLFAVKLHPAMRHAGPVRKDLGVRTIFNLLGPLTNPAGATRQLMGVFDPDLTETIAHVLGKLGATRAMVLHAEDGLDEISTTAPTKISEYLDGQVTTYTVTPEQLGLPRASLTDLLVETPQQSAQVIRGVLEGGPGPARDMVLLNAAAGAVVAGKADDLPAGLVLAADAIDSGRALDALTKLVDLSHGGDA